MIRICNTIIYLLHFAVLKSSIVCSEGNWGFHHPGLSSAGIEDAGFTKIKEGISRCRWSGLNCLSKMAAFPRPKKSEKGDTVTLTLVDVGNDPRKTAIYHLCCSAVEALKKKPGYISPDKSKSSRWKFHDFLNMIFMCLLRLQDG